MSLQGPRKAICPNTGLAVPECSCTRCLEAMLREFHPTVPEPEIRIRRLAQPNEPGGDRPRTA